MDHVNLALLLSFSVAGVQQRADLIQLAPQALQFEIELYSLTNPQKSTPSNIYYVSSQILRTCENFGLAMRNSRAVSFLRQIFSKCQHLRSLLNKGTIESNFQNLCLLRQPVDGINASLGYRVYALLFRLGACFASQLTASTRVLSAEFSCRMPECACSNLSPCLTLSKVRREHILQRTHSTENTAMPRMCSRTCPHA